jgi:ElaB/YqjD/DUF883 family membrane-anchored ribosome-binding protein
MNRAVFVGSGLLVLGLAVGCGGGDDAVIKDQISLMNEVAAAYDTVTDADSWKKAQAEVEKLQPRAEELRKKENSWSEEKKKQLGEKYANDLQAATDRLEAARKAARKKAGGKGEAL